MTPSCPRRTWPSLISCSMTVRAMLVGIEKPLPILPPDGDRWQVSWRYTHNLFLFRLFRWPQHRVSDDQLILFSTCPIRGLPRPCEMTRKCPIGDLQTPDHCELAA